MVKIIMHGCNGHMGQVITGLVKEDANAEIIAGIDMNDNGQNDYPVFKSLAECDVPADVVVDFSSYKAADALLDACKEKKLPLVLCTTGLTEDQLKKVQETSKEIPVLRSANMSLGVNTLMKLVQAAAKVLAEAGFDMEIVEKHHKLKCDAPSGTAIALADSLNEAMDNQYTMFMTEASATSSVIRRKSESLPYAAARSSEITTSSSQDRTRLLSFPTGIFQRSFRKRSCRGCKIPGWKTGWHV